MRFLFHYSRLTACLTACLLLTLIHTAVFGYQVKEYNLFFSNHENVFLYRPSLIKSVFHGLIELKQNKSLATRYINYEVLGCQPDSRIKQGCRIDRLRLERRKKGISSVLTLPVNFTHIDKFPFNKRLDLIIVHWKPELFKPPSISVDAFLQYLAVASESRYYRVKPQLKRLQLNPLFERRISILVEKKLARSLVELYESPPSDQKDSISYVYDFMTDDIRGDTIDFFIQFRAVNVTINHLKFKTSEFKK